MKFLTSDPRKIFLLDSAGALLTAILLFDMLAYFEEYFRVPVHMLNALAATAFLFSVYSFCCYFFSGEKWKMLLRIIITANVLYACATLVLMFVLRKEITGLAVLYFSLESAVIAALVFLEIRILRR